MNNLTTPLQKPPSKGFLTTYQINMENVIDNETRYISSEFGIQRSNSPFHCNFVSSLEEDVIRQNIEVVINNCHKARYVPQGENLDRSIQINKNGSYHEISIRCNGRGTGTSERSLTRYITEQFNAYNSEFDANQKQIIDYCKLLLFNDQYWYEKKHQSNELIQTFEKANSFLSNFFQANVDLNSAISNSENLYQSKKFLQQNRENIKKDLTNLKKNRAQAPILETFDDFISYILTLQPHKAKSFSKKFHKNILQNNLRPDWDRIKIDYMILITYLKFTQNPELKEKLLETGNAFLTEGGHDSFWGVKDGAGTNYLGKILMIIRDILKKQPESENNNA